METKPPAPTDQTRPGNTARQFHALTDHGENPLDEQYADTMNPELRPRPHKLYPTLPPIPLRSAADLQPSEVPALDAIAEPGGSGSTGDRIPDLETLARLCFFTDGITRRIRRGDRLFDFRAAPCTGALYHAELYLVCGELPGLPAGIYHYGVQDHALRRLRQGDLREVVVEAADGEPALARAPVVMVTTSVFWRNAWKYANRAYRHAYWDTGTMLPNTLAVAAAADLPASLVLAFADQPIADLLGLDLAREGVIALVPLGRTGEPIPAAPTMTPLDLPTEPYSVREIDYPAIRETHRATLLATGTAAGWRSRGAQPEQVSANAGNAPIPLPSPDPRTLPTDPIEAVIRRRGSTRTFERTPINLNQLSILLDGTTRGIPSDSLGSDGVPFNDAYLIVNAVAGLQPGTYRYRRAGHAVEPLRDLSEATARERSHYLALEQELGGDAAVNVYFLADLDAILDRYGDRGYRLAHLGASLVAGKLYLASYALGLGATGLTYLDDEVVDFFSPAAARKDVMFLIAIGPAARRPLPVPPAAV